MLLKCFQIIFRLAFEADHGENGYRIAQGRSVDVGMVGFDRARLLERAHAAKAGRGGQPDFGCKFHIRDSAICL